MMRIFPYILLLVGIHCHGQWIFVDIPTKASFRALKSHKNDMWVAGTQGTVGHSTDAGKTWTFKQVSNAEKLDFRDLAILNKQEVLLMSAGHSEEGKAVIFQTLDRGNTWHEKFQLQESGYFFDCILWDSKKRKSWLLSDPINQRLTLFSIDHKEQKQINPNHAPILQPKEAFFAASGSSMALLKNRLIFVGGGADSARIYVYQTNKDFWKIKSPGIATGEAKGYFSVGAKNNKEIWAVGGDYRKLNELNIPIIRSYDGGQNWKILKESPQFYMEKVIWAKPYWIVSGPSQSAAYHEKTNQWRNLGKSSFHNIIQVGDTIWGIGAKGQLGYISLSSIDQLFLSKE